MSLIPSINKVRASLLQNLIFKVSQTWIRKILVIFRILIYIIKGCCLLIKLSFWSIHLPMFLKFTLKSWIFWLDSLNKFLLVIDPIIADFNLGWDFASFFGFPSDFLTELASLNCLVSIYGLLILYPVLEGLWPGIFLSLRSPGVGKTLSKIYKSSTHPTSFYV